MQTCTLYDYVRHVTNYVHCTVVLDKGAIKTPNHVHRVNGSVNAKLMKKKVILYFYTFIILYCSAMYFNTVLFYLL